MAVVNVGLISRVRRNQSLLVFLSTTGVVMLLWYVLLGIALAGDSEMFQAPVDWTTLLLAWLLAPLLGAPVVSGLAMLIAGLVNQKGCGFLLILLLGVAIPIAALIIVGIGSAIARALYIAPDGEVSDLQRATLEPQSEA